MSLLSLFDHRSIVTQIIGVVLAAIALAILCTSGVFIYLSSGSRDEVDSRYGAVSFAARIATVLEDAPQNPSLPDLKKAIASSQQIGMAIDILPIGESLSQPLPNSHEQPRVRVQESSLVGALRNELVLHWNVPSSEITVSSDDTIIVRVTDQYALAFHVKHYPAIERFIVIQVGFVVATVVIVVVFLVTYIIKRLMAPLSTIAATADAMGHVSAQTQPLDATGPKEVNQVARALSHLHERLQALIEERTRMLAAISHDLRTPLTRLRLRLERHVTSPELLNMFDDIEIIDNMISEILHYLREQKDRRIGDMIDISSLVQTVCNEFVDMGFDVQYSGPPKMALFCEELGMRRAISNIIDNAVKHGTKVAVKVESLPEGGLEIQVSDNGPGIPQEYRAKVLEPFHVADSARSLTGRTGFGLGLSIVRDIVSRHCGAISFADNLPSGLVVRLLFDRTLP